MTGADGLNNNIMGSMAGHPFFRLAVDLLQSYDKNYLLPYLTIMTSAGPHYLTFMWKKYMHSRDSRTEGYRVYRLMPYQRKEGRWENEFFSISEGETWATWDTKLLIWEGNHVVIATVLNICFLVSVSVSIWIFSYSLARLLVQRAKELIRAAKGISA
jgi:inositol phosphorylceramide mannosyltransferase catalytic subunit